MLREFKLGDLQFNYGCLPRTWEDPNHPHPDTGFNGDDDPIDVCEIGLRPIPTGAIRSVKVCSVYVCVRATSCADAPMVCTWPSLQRTLLRLLTVPSRIDCAKQTVRNRTVRNHTVPNRTVPNRTVQVLGVLAMIDDEETDWKLVCIDADDPWADSVNDIDDIDKIFPGLLFTVREWFRNYKVGPHKAMWCG